MTDPVAWERVEAALDDILERPESEWPATLQRIAGADEALHRELVSLMAKVGGVDALLDHPPMADSQTAPATGSLSPGVRLGAYRIERFIGRGGMGEVYAAERDDGQFRHQVALKLLQRDAAVHVDRFHAERQILARLEHPGIARLYDGGVSPDGRPFMVMELVDGMQIVAWCRGRHLDLKQILSLFLAVCDAVAFAHRNLIVHRDLKPSNVLVTPSGAVKLLDFGVAKLLDPDRHEQTQAVPMTPAYAAPEQLTQGVITTAADVYSLGLVLFELLSGHRPWELSDLSIVAGIEKVLQSIPPTMSEVAGERGGSPVPPATLQGDLDAIVAKTLRKEPALRYESVAALQADITRYLRSEPVQARAGARLYVAGRFIRRHRVPVAATLAVLLAVLVGSGAALWQARAARLEAARADAIKTFVLSLLTDADTDSGAGPATTTVDLLIAARGRVDAELADQPHVRVELLNTIAYGLIGYGETAHGVEIAQKAVALGSQILGPSDSRTLAAKVTLGEGLIDVGRNLEAIDLLRTAAADASAAGRLETQVNALRWLSSAYINQGDLDLSGDAAREAVRIVSQPDARLSARTAMDTYATYANMLVFAQRSGAVAALESALQWSRKVFGSEVTRTTLELRTMLGRALVNEGRPAEGISFLEASGPATEKLLGPKHPALGIFGKWLGAARLATGDLDGAITAYARGIAVDDARSDEDSVFDRGKGRLGLGASFLAARRPADARRALEDALTLLTRGSDAQNPSVLRARSLRVLALARLGEWDSVDREVAALESAPWRPEDKAEHECRLSEMQLIRKQVEDAVRLAHACATQLAQHPLRWMRADAHAHLGRALEAAGQFREALPELVAAREDYQASLLHGTPDQADTLLALGRAQEAVGDPQGAAASLAAGREYWRERMARPPMAAPPVLPLDVKQVPNARIRAT